MAKKEQLQKSDNALRRLKDRVRALLDDNQGKRPSNFAKLRDFTDELLTIITEETASAGYVDPVPLKLPDADPHKVVEEPIQQRQNLTEREETEDVRSENGAEKGNDPGAEESDDGADGRDDSTAGSEPGGSHGRSKRGTKSSSRSRGRK